MIKDYDSFDIKATRKWRRVYQGTTYELFFKSPSGAAMVASGPNMTNLIRFANNGFKLEGMRSYHARRIIVRPAPIKEAQ